MNVTSAQTDPNTRDLVKLVENVWDSHPFRRQNSDRKLENVTVEVTEGDRFGVNSNNYPNILLKVGRHPERDGVSLEAAICHELTHLIDRHDPTFIGDRSIEEAGSKINSIPEGDVNESILDAFHTYWNAYIDGRLARAGILVDTFERRLEEKLASRQGTEFVN